MKGLVRGLIKIYQHTWSQVMPPACRYEPTCSQYTYEAIGKYGFFKGTWLGMKRFVRCHPWGGEGYDPVP